MKLCLGLTESSAPDQTRMFGVVDDKLVDLRLAYAAHLVQAQKTASEAYDLSSFYFPASIQAFLEHGEAGRSPLEAADAFIRRHGLIDSRGPSGERLIYESGQVRLLPPLLTPEKSFVIGFADKARTEGIPKAALPTAFYKLPQTFIASEAPILWPQFSAQIDADACLAIVIGKAGRRIAPEHAWDYVAGVTLLIDITARDVNKREGATTNNLLGKNFPSSAAVGPAVLLTSSREEIEKLPIELSLDGVVRQSFSLSESVFSVEQIIARWSILGIKPGDFLAVGASMAVKGERLQNPIPLKIGSTLCCTAPAVGELSHRVVEPERLQR